MQDIDIYRTAKIIIDRHGDAALLEAMKHIESHRARGDVQAMCVWKRVSDAIEWMQMPNDLKGETQH